MQTLIKALLAILLTASLSWAESTVVVVGQPVVAAASYVFEEDFADNSAGWTLNNNATIGSGYLTVVGSYSNAVLSTTGILTTGVEYTITFDVTAVNNANWLEFDHPAGTRVGAYITTTATYSRTWTETSTKTIRFIIDDSTAGREYRIDNIKICAGTTCN